MAKKTAKEKDDRTVLQKASQEIQNDANTVKKPTDGELEFLEYLSSLEKIRTTLSAFNNKYKGQGKNLQKLFKDFDDYYEEDQQTLSEHRKKSSLSSKDIEEIDKITDKYAKLVFSLFVGSTKDVAEALAKGAASRDGIKVGNLERTLRHITKSRRDLGFVPFALFFRRNLLLYGYGSSDVWALQPFDERSTAKPRARYNEKEIKDFYTDAKNIKPKLHWRTADVSAGFKVSEDPATELAVEEWLHGYSIIEWIFEKRDI